MPYVQEAVSSILSQTYVDFELILVDDGSTDGSKEYLASLNDPRIKFIMHPANQGEAAARNTGLSQAQGEYIAMMDADDISHPERLSRQIAFMESHPHIALCGCYAERFGKVSSRMRFPTQDKIIKTLIVLRYCFCNATIMFRRHLLGKYTYPPLKYGCDTHFVDCIALENRVANLPEVLYRYRIHTDSITWNTDREHWQRMLFDDLIRKKFHFIPTQSDTEAHLAFVNRNFKNNTAKIGYYLLKLISIEARLNPSGWLIFFAYGAYRYAKGTLKTLYKH